MKGRTKGPHLDKLSKCGEVEKLPFQGPGVVKVVPKGGGGFGQEGSFSWARTATNFFEPDGDGLRKQSVTKVKKDSAGVAQ